MEDRRTDAFFTRLPFHGKKHKRLPRRELHAAHDTDHPNNTSP